MSVKELSGKAKIAPVKAKVLLYAMAVAILFAVPSGIFLLKIYVQTQLNNAQQELISLERSREILNDEITSLHTNVAKKQSEINQLENDR